MGTDLEKVKIKEVRIFSSTGRHEHDRVFKVGVYGLDEIKYEYDPLNQTYSLNLYEKKATGERFHAATLYKADYIGFDPVENAEENGATPAIQGDIETLRDMISDYETEPLTKYPAELYSTISLKSNYAKGEVLTFWDKPWLCMPYPQQFEIMQIIVSYTDNGKETFSIFYKSQSFFTACKSLNANTHIAMTIQEYPIQHRVVFNNLVLTANDAGMYTLETRLHRSIKIHTQEISYIRMEFVEDAVFPEGAEISISLIGNIYASSEPKLKVANNTSYPV